MPDSSRLAAARVLRALPAITRALAAEVRKAGTDAQLTLAQFSALQLLAESALSVGELARLMHVAMPTVTQSVDSLVSKGLASRTADDQDRRQVHLHITAMGLRVLTESLDEVEAYLREMLQGMPTGQQEDLAAALEHVLERIETSVSTRV